MYGIKIEDGEKIKCPNCSAIFAIQNKWETLFRNITLLYFKKNRNQAEAKCKQCKNIIQIKFSDDDGSIKEIK